MIKKRLEKLEGTMGSEGGFSCDHPFGRELAIREGRDPDDLSRADASRLGMLGFSRWTFGPRETITDVEMRQACQDWQDKFEATMAELESRLIPGATIGDYVIRGDAVLRDRI